MSWVWLPPAKPSLVAFKAIKEGLKDQAGKTLMKPVEGVTNDELKALVVFLRTFKW